MSKFAPKEVLEAIQELVDYNWADELEDFRQVIEERSPNGHIFCSLLAVDNWLNDTNVSLEEATADPAPALEIAKMEQLRELCRLPGADGEQFIHVDLNLSWGNAGVVRYGFGWKSEMGEYNFKSLDEAIDIVNRLRQRAKL